MIRRNYHKRLSRFFCETCGERMVVERWQQGWYTVRVDSCACGSLKHQRS